MNPVEVPAAAVVAAWHQMLFGDAAGLYASDDTLWSWLDEPARSSITSIADHRAMCRVRGFDGECHAGLRERPRGVDLELVWIAPGVGTDVVTVADLDDVMVFALRFVGVDSSEPNLVGWRIHAIGESVLPFV